jgi:serine/threonine protein kinase
MAPEMIKQQSYDYKIDVWSACVIIYALMIGEMPFDGMYCEEV